VKLISNLFLILQKNHVREMYVEYTNHGEDLGLILYFKKDKIAEES